MVDSEGEEILLRHEFIIGDVTTALLSLGKFYQSGWKVDGSDEGQLFLEDPNKQVKIPVHFRNKSFAIKACVRHVEAGHELSDVDCVRAIVAAHNEVEEKEMNSWEMTESGTPFYKCLGNSFVDPRPVWGLYWRYRTTLIRVHQGEDRNWLLVELSQLYMDREDPFEPIEECMIKMGGLECEILTLLGKHEHGVEQIGVLVDESDDFIGGEGQEQPHFADVLELPPGLAEDPQGGGEAAPMEFIEAEELPEEQVHLYDDFVITKNSRILDLRTACHWLGVSQAGSKTAAI